MRSVKWLVAASAASVLLGFSLAGHAQTRAAASPACDRACLEGIAEKYLAGMLTHDPSKAGKRVSREKLASIANSYWEGLENNHDATVRQYQVKDGTTRTVKNTGPWTWGTHEVFQINAEGQISQVEAVLLAVPYGQLPGWDTGMHFPSEQAKKDGFKEF